MEQRVHITNHRFPIGLVSRLSQSAIIAGIFIAIAVQLLLNFLGLGIGFGSIAFYYGF